jgi:2-alkyl-3-oxoalkanoate reductase
MRILLAGATGAIGRPLLPLLADAGHDVVGTTRSAEKADAIRAAGAEPAIVDAEDLSALRETVTAARPEVVINQLTRYDGPPDPRKPETMEPTSALRREVGPALAQMAASAGARRLISQSVAIFYAPVGGGVKTEEEPLLDPPPETPFGGVIAGLKELERSTLETQGVEGVVLRYGYFYGPGTWYAPGGDTAEEVRKRRFPLIGRGEGIFSFVHVDDAAAATLAAVERGAPGIYNVTDDDPAAIGIWLPEYAAALGAKRPRRVPAWLAKLVGPRDGVEFLQRLRGASNEKAKRELGWKPRYPSWRIGFRQALG